MTLSRIEPLTNKRPLRGRLLKRIDLTEARLAASAPHSPCPLTKTIYVLITRMNWKRGFWSSMSSMP
jgi:hypothetical protein